MTYLIFVGMLVFASIFDIKHREIPNTICILIAVLSLTNFHFLGFLAALPFFIAAYFEPEKMGGGDIKLTAAVGLFLGFFDTIFGVIIALTLSILFYFLSKRKFKSLPLAPFLTVGFVTILLIERTNLL